MTEGAIIYLDHQAHSPVDPRALAAMLDAYRDCDFNPHSSHAAGDVAAKALAFARERVAELISASPAEILFTPGATEANNMAFLGLTDDLRVAGRTRVVVSAGEHPSVLAAAAAMQGFQVSELALNGDGLVNLTHLSDLLGPDVGLVSVAAANHEVGSVQPVAAIAMAARACGALFHSDLAQAAGKVPVSADDLDLASLSSHKLGGPSGIGALYVRRRMRRRLRRLLHRLPKGGVLGRRNRSTSAPLLISKELGQRV